MLLLSRIYKTDSALFQRLLNSVLESDDVIVGPTFIQQAADGGAGIPDAMIVQPSFKIVVETKLWSNTFWGKEEYSSHFRNESQRILITLSKQEIPAQRVQEFKTALSVYDKETKATGTTVHVHLTYGGLIAALRGVIDATRTRYRIEMEELIEDYEDFVSSLGLIDDVHLRMHVAPVGQTYGQNLEHKLYYNGTNRNYSDHKFIGLYYWKEIRHIGETRTVFIPSRTEEGELTYNYLKGEEYFTEEKRKRFEEFLSEFVDDEGYGDDGSLRFHLFDEWVDTHFRKESPGGIMGPRHCYLPDYIPEGLSEISTADFVAGKLNGEVWEVG